MGGTTLHGINVSLSIQELGAGTGQRLKKRALLAEGCDSPYLLGFLVELIQWRLESEQDYAKSSKLVSEAEDLCKRLSCELDVIRARYWTFIQNTISKKYGRSD